MGWSGSCFKQLEHGEAKEGTAEKPPGIPAAIIAQCLSYSPIHLSFFLSFLQASLCEAAIINKARCALLLLYSSTQLLHR